MMHTLSLGTVLLDQLAAAVHAVRDRLLREHDQEEAHVCQAHEPLPADSDEALSSVSPHDLQTTRPHDGPHARCSAAARTLDIVHKADDGQGRRLQHRHFCRSATLGKALNLPR